MREIPLSNGGAAFVDDEDFDLIAAYRWRRNIGGYAVRSTTQNGVNRTYSMHRVIFGAVSGQQVDHIDRNRLNNVRANLRLATASQNAINRVSASKTGYRGVQQDYRRFKAMIWAAGQFYLLGRFSNAIEAARAYDKAARQLHGDFAVLNFPEGA